MTSQDIIIIGADPWEHYVWRRRHHIAWGLARDNRVLLIEPPLSVFQPFTEIDFSFKHLFRLGKLQYHGRNLYTYSPLKKYPLSLPLGRIFDYAKMNYDDVVKKIKRVVDKLGFKNPILWVYYHSYQYDYYGLFDEKIVVADWFDKNTAPSGLKTSQNVTDEIINREEKIINKAKIIFAASKELADDLKKRTTNPNIYTIPHGVDIDSFTDGSPSNDNIIKRLKDINRPIIGFLGLMHYVIDFQLLNFIAEKRPEWSIILIGKKWLRDENDIKQFKALKDRINVSYLGEIKRESISGCLKYFDVCLMPFKKVEHVWYSAPLKLWEYMAAGKPIVTIEHGMENDYDDYLYKANSYDMFLSKIEIALKGGGDKDLANVRINIARNNSWEHRINQMMQIIEELL